MTEEAFILPRFMHLKTSTGKSLSEALIFASTNPQYEDRLFIELQVQYMKIPNSEHGENMFCKRKSFWQFMCLVLFLPWVCIQSLSTFGSWTTSSRTLSPIFPLSSLNLSKFEWFTLYFLWLLFSNTYHTRVIIGRVI